MKASNFQFWLLYGVLKCFAILPFRILYGISDFLSFVAYRIVRYRVGVVRKNLRNSFPDKTEKELRKIERQFYRHLGDVIVETIKLLHISDRQLLKRVVVTNPELAEKIISETPAIILYLGHYANWEWVPVTRMWLNSDITMGSLYKPLLSKPMDRLTHIMRERLGITLIKSREAYRRLLEMKRDGEKFMMGFIADQRPLGQPLHHWTLFMGQPTAFVAGGETIGNRVGARYLYLEMNKIKRGHYTITFKTMEVSPDDNSDFPYTRLYYRMLEETIRKAPPYWLWSHNRWKASPPADFAASLTPAPECRQ